MFGKVVSKFKDLKNKITRKNGNLSIQGEHEFKETITIDYFYPDHPPRKESAVYRASRKHLIDDLQLSCEICKTRDQLETHHYYCEWAYANAVNWDVMKVLHPSFDWSTFKEPADFVDSVYNLKVLCAKHHRGKNHGIHCVPLPQWQTQAFMEDDFVLTHDQAEELIQ